MWYLKWKSKNNPFDSNGTIHYQPLTSVTSINQKIEAREHAIIAWENIINKKEAIKFSYQDPQLVWEESLIPEK